MTAAEMARALGRKGGRSRARRLSPTEKRRIASLGGTARRRSFEAARRIAENLRYAAAVAELQAQPRAIGQKAFSGRLPGLYPDSA